MLLQQASGMGDGPSKMELASPDSKLLKESIKSIDSNPGKCHAKNLMANFIYLSGRVYSKSGVPYKGGSLGLLLFIYLFIKYIQTTES